MITKENYSVRVITLSEGIGKIGKMMSENVPESLMVASENRYPDLKAKQANKQHILNHKMKEQGEKHLNLA